MITLTYKIYCDYCARSSVLKPVQIPVCDGFQTAALPYPVLPDGWAIIGFDVVCNVHDIIIGIIE